MRPHPADTDRLRFRLWTRSDGELAWALFGDPEVTRLVGGPFSREQVAERLSWEIANQASAGVQYWPLFAEDDFVGACGLKPRESWFEFGFYLRRPHWGRGYGVEAGRAVIDWAYADLGVTRLYAGHHPQNEASRGALLKLGFARTHEELYPPTGLVHPGYTHSGGASAS